MKTVNLNDRSTFIASADLVDQLKAKIKEGDVILNFAFTDYGGTFYDKVIIRYFEERHPESIVSEDTAWYGKNAFIFGELAKQFIEANENYLLGFEDTESFFSEMEDSEQNNEAQRVLKENPQFKLKGISISKLANWFAENCQITTQGVDYSWERMESAILNNEIE